MTVRADRTGATVIIERKVAATPERVFRAWTDPARLARWMSPIGHARAEVDLRVGGAFRLVMIGDGREIEHVGEYRAIEPPHRLAFTWRSAYTGDRDTLVTVTFRATGGGTALRLVHEGLPVAAAESHRGGWGGMLDRLPTALEERGTKR